MAFIKNKNENHSELNKNNLQEIISIPLVFVKKNNNGIIQYNGFVPGFYMNDIVEKQLEVCQQRLEATIKQKIKNRLSKGQHLPFFPDNKEIISDFNPIAIKRMNIKIKKNLT